MKKRQNPRGALLLSAVVLISGCRYYVTAPNIPEADIVAESDTAIIVGSVTQSSDGDPDPYDEQAEFYFRHKDANRIYRITSAEIKRPVLGPPNRVLADPGLEEQHGKLFAVRLQPGVYEFVRFAILWPSQQELFFADPLEFELFPGDIVYIGNFDARFCVRHAYANQYGVSGVIVSVNDHMARDVPLLTMKFPALRQADITKKILPDQDLQQQTAPLRKGCE